MPRVWSSACLWSSWFNSNIFFLSYLSKNNFNLAIFISIGKNSHVKFNFQTLFSLPHSFQIPQWKSSGQHFRTSVKTQLFMGSFTSDRSVTSSRSWNTFEIPFNNFYCFSEFFGFFQSSFHFRSRAYWFSSSSSRKWKIQLWFMLKKRMFVSLISTFRLSQSVLDLFLLKVITSCLTTTNLLRTMKLCSQIWLKTSEFQVLLIKN